MKRPPPRCPKCFTKADPDLVHVCPISPKDERRRRAGHNPNPKPTTPNRRPV